MATQLTAVTLMTAASEFFVLAEGASGSALDAPAAPMAMFTDARRTTLTTVLLHFAVSGTVPTSLTNVTATTNLPVRANSGPATKDAIVLYFSMFALLALVLWFLFLIGGVFLVVVLLVVGHDDNGYADLFYHNVR